MNTSKVYKEYQVEGERIILYVVIFIIISSIIIGIIAKTVIESNQVLSKYDDNVKSMGQLLETDGDVFVDIMSYDMESSYYKETIFSLVILFVAVVTVFHINFFTKTKLIIDTKGIELYSLYSKNPSTIFFWNEIKSIQFGEIITQGSRFPKYGMKIRYIKKSYSEHEQLKEFVPIKRFDNYFDLIEDLEQIAKEHSIDIYHIND